MSPWYDGERSGSGASPQMQDEERIRLYAALGELAKQIKDLRNENKEARTEMCALRQQLRTVTETRVDAGEDTTEEKDKEREEELVVTSDNQQQQQPPTSRRQNHHHHHHHVLLQKDQDGVQQPFVPEEYDEGDYIPQSSPASSPASPSSASQSNRLAMMQPRPSTVDSRLSRPLLSTPEALSTFSWMGGGNFPFLLGNVDKPFIMLTQAALGCAGRVAAVNRPFLSIFGYTEVIMILLL